MESKLWMIKNEISLYSLRKAFTAVVKKQRINFQKWVVFNE